MNSVVSKDLLEIYNKLSDKEKGEFHNSIIMITGCAGFLGFYLTNFFIRFKKELGINRIIGIDNFKVGKPKWINGLEEEGNLELYESDITSIEFDIIKNVKEVTHIYHMASIASPIYYRMYPLETMDANVNGLRRLLDYYKNSMLKKFIYFSSSEIYGDAEIIPTPECYNGNVSCIGPRSCYDEAKRYCETICYFYNKKFNMPIKIIRPFNNYGPGIKMNDKRVTADFANCVINNKDIIMYSDGKPTRTFCYISDAILGYLKVTAYDGFDFFNIGSDKPEITIRELAEKFEKVGKKYFNYKGQVICKKSDEEDYLTNNPNRRCPDINKARNLIGFEPVVEIEQGIKRFLEYLRES